MIPEAEKQKAEKADCRGQTAEKPKAEREKAVGRWQGGLAISTNQQVS
jgi:hypothetical protein